MSIDIDESISNRVAEAVRLHPDSNEIWPLETIAFISKRVAGDDANVGLVPSSNLNGRAQIALRQVCASRALVFCRGKRSKPFA